MKKPAFVIALVTAPEMKTARRLAQAALKKRLCACANLVPRIESHYRWQGRIEQSREVLLLFKTQARLVSGLENLISSLHPYDTPEFVIVKLAGGNRRYLFWLTEAVAQ